MCVKLPLEDLNPSPYPKYLINIYTYKVITTPWMRGCNYHISNLALWFFFFFCHDESWNVSGCSYYLSAFEKSCVEAQDLISFSENCLYFEQLITLSMTTNFISAVKTKSFRLFTLSFLRKQILTLFNS